MRSWLRSSFQRPHDEIDAALVAPAAGIDQKIIMARIAPVVVVKGVYVICTNPLHAGNTFLGLVSVHVFGGARHETLNDTNRDEVMTVLGAWIDRVTAA